MKKQVVRSWQFRSSSNPSLFYTTLLYATGDASCSCPAWCKRTAADGTRSCKHLIAAGIASAGTGSVPKDVPVKSKTVFNSKHGTPVSKGIARKMCFDD